MRHTEKGANEATKTLNRGVSEIIILAADAVSALNCPPLGRLAILHERSDTRGR